MNPFGPPPKPVQVFPLVESNTFDLFGFPPNTVATNFSTESDDASDSKAIDAGFNYETFPLLALKDKLNCLPLMMIAEIELQVPKQKISSHACPLVKHPVGHNNGWDCDKIKGSDRCLSGLKGFYQSKGIPGYYC